MMDPLKKFRSIARDAESSARRGYPPGKLIYAKRYRPKVIDTLDSERSAREQQAFSPQPVRLRHETQHCFFNMKLLGFVPQPNLHFLMHRRHQPRPAWLVARHSLLASFHEPSGDAEKFQLCHSHESGNPVSFVNDAGFPPSRGRRFSAFGQPKYLLLSLATSRVLLASRHGMPREPVSICLSG